MCADLSKAEKILLELEQRAEREHLPIVGPEKGKVIEDMISRFKPKRILEIGTFFGYSAIMMAKGLGSDVRMTTIELDREEAEIAKENMEKAELLPKIDILIGDASNILPRLKGEFDLVFFDAAKEDNMEHLALIENKLKKGSILIADNAGILAYKMTDYLDYVRNSGKYESKYFDMGEDGMEISIKN